MRLSGGNACRARNALTGFANMRSSTVASATAKQALFHHAGMASDTGKGGVSDGAMELRNTDG